MAGQITALNVQTRRKNRVNVFLDGKFAFGLAKSIALGLGIGQSLSDQEIQELQTRDAVTQLHQKALRLLAVRPRSTAELRRAFTRKGELPAVQDQVLKELREVGLVDDQAFARSWVENRLAFRPRGKRALKAELLQKGISSEIITEALEGVDEGKAVWAAAAKAGRRFRSLDYDEFKQKLFGYLSRRGFSYDMILPVIDRAWQDHADLDQEREEPR